MLKFSPIKKNAKLAWMDKAFGKGYTFSMLSGHTCKFAKLCFSRAMRDKNGKTTIKDGKFTEFRCFSASQEVLYPTLYNQRQWNSDLIAACQTVHQTRELIQRSLPSKAKVIRIHVGGDFNSQRYFDAWLAIAYDNPNTLFYAYTKALPYWVARINGIPKNLILTASRGGTHDHLIGENDLQEAVVVESEEEAESLGLPIDHDDSHAIINGGSFALLIHGPQPAGSTAGRAVMRLNGVGSYGKASRAKAGVK